MPDLIYSEQFVEDLLQVKSAILREKILDSIDLLRYIPEMGSQRLPLSVIELYGNNVRKLVVSPFLIIYKQLNFAQIEILGLIYARAAY